MRFHASRSAVTSALASPIRFLYKVVHTNGRLRKFNRSREIEVNFFYRLDYLYETLAHLFIMFMATKVASEFLIFV